jgi:dihydrofolate synthase / folylpolyglutamate synthase
VVLPLRDYRQALDYLFARTTGESRLGLDRTAAFLALLGDPHRRFATFHIAGTNGKGSVAATLDALLRARRLRVARYTSPHLVDFRERMLVDGSLVDATAIVDFIERWTPDIERIGATFFEATTAMAFDLFAQAAVDVAVVETGLGGRLDATNVVVPRVAGVTMIGIDHTELLGESLGEIAREKAGIFKRGAAAVIGEPDSMVRGWLASHARSAGASPIVTVADTMPVSGIAVRPDGTHFDWTRDPSRSARRRLRTPLIGHHQAANAATAIAMLDAAGAGYSLDDDELEHALARVVLPGRFHRHEQFIFDVAHNPAGAEVLAATLRAVSPPTPVVALVTVLRDKDWRGMLSALAPAIDHFVVSIAPTAPASRLWDPREAVAFARENGWSAELETDFDRALARASDVGASVVVTGSFHTVGDAMARLQVAPHAG